MNEEGQEVFAHDAGDIDSAEGIVSQEDFRQELYRRAEAGMFTKEVADKTYMEVLSGNFENVPDNLLDKAKELFGIPAEETPEETA